MATMTLIEILATVAGLLFVILLILDRVICWPIGILGSALSVYLFVDTKLYSEAMLYGFYVAFGIWGWIRWHQRQQNNPVQRLELPQHLQLISICSALALILGYSFATYTDAARPYIDAFTTIFSFAATYLEVKKVLDTWGYWIVLNAVSIWLYHDRSLDIYAALITVYSILSVWGFMQWRQQFRQEQSALLIEHQTEQQPAPQPEQSLVQ